MTIAIDVDRPWVRASERTPFASDDIAPGDYFAVADESSARSFGIWQFDGNDAWRVDLGPEHPRRRVSVPAGVDVVRALRAAVASNTPTVHRMELPPRGYYPGMARPETSSYGGAAFQAPDYHWRSRELVASLLQLRSLYRALEAIFDVVHPTNENVATYGNSIRDLIILACTECEAQWLAILRLNDYQKSKPTRRDYQKLGKPMRLSEYTVILQHYREIEALVPFAGWDGTQEGAPLPWYDDYNALKHDRAGSFHRSTLGSALNAVAACWVMIAAQYGYRALRELPDLQDKMRIWYAPRWSLSECYFAEGHGFSPDTAVKYPL